MDFVETSRLNSTRVRQQKYAALTPLLTPQEREQYDLWFSDASARVRDSVFGMEATEEEFLKLYALQKELDRKNSPPARTLIRRGARRLKQAPVALGEQRYGEWLRAQDPDYREIVRVTSRFKLSAAVAAELYSYKQPIEEQRAAGRCRSKPDVATERCCLSCHR